MMVKGFVKKITKVCCKVNIVEWIMCVTLTMTLWLEKGQKDHHLLHEHKKIVLMNWNQRHCSVFHVLCKAYIYIHENFMSE